MSWCDRRRLVTGAAAIAGAATLSGCGFAPVYGPAGGGTALRGNVRADDPAVPRDFALVARLEDRLGRPAAPRFGLDYDISVRQSDLALTDDNEITRINLEGAVRFVLADLATGEEVLADRVSTFAAYSTTASTVATAAARRDAEARLMTALADQIVSRLLARAGASA